MKEEVPRIINFLSGKISPPTKLEVELTALCNMRCRFCWIVSPPPFRKRNLHNEMSADKWMDIARQSAEMGVLFWRICGGGEPLVRKDVLLPLIKEIKKFGMIGHLTTNGVLFSDDDISFFVSNQWDVIEFSIDAPNAEIHDFLRDYPGAFERAVSTIKKFQKEKAIYSSEKPHIIISMVGLRQNYPFFSDMIKLASDLGVEKVAVNPLTVMTRWFLPWNKVNSLKIKSRDIPHLNQEILKAKEIADNLGIDTNIHHFLQTALVKKTGKMKSYLKHLKKDDLPQGFRSVCYSPWYVIAIRPHGTAGPCCRFYDYDADSLKELSLEQCWTSEKFNLLRKELLSGKLPRYCQGCSPNNVYYESEIRQQIKEYLSTNLHLL